MQLCQYTAKGHCIVPTDAANKLTGTAGECVNLGYHYGEVQLNLHNGVWDVSYVLVFWHEDADHVIRIFENEAYTVILTELCSFQELR